MIPTSACKNGHVDLNKMNAILSKFVGTKMFHNFTQNLVNNRVKQKQKNSEEQPEDVQPKQFTRMENGVSKLQPMDENTIYNRNIFYFKATKVIHVNNQQFILVKVSGNGFLYNQIRKMVACMLCVYNDYYDASTFLDIALESDVKVNLPIAPPETLLLNNMGFRPRKNVMYMDFSHEKIVAEVINCHGTNNCSVINSKWNTFIQKWYAPCKKTILLNSFFPMLKSKTLFINTYFVTGTTCIPKKSTNSCMQKL